MKIKKYIAGLLATITILSCVGCANITKTNENILTLRKQREDLFCESIGTTREEFKTLWESEGFEEDFYIGAIEVFLEGMELSAEEYSKLTKEDTDEIFSELSEVFVGNVDVTEEEMKILESFTSYKAILLLLEEYNSTNDLTQEEIINYYKEATFWTMSLNMEAYSLAMEEGLLEEMPMAEETEIATE